ncbi:MAG: EscU/YscU/HrcU family type III secretion system export apparatus switch protein [Arcobacteraceae bacterium]|jgi:flagellar biosynthesis protein|nr:EscU/YscU/HrcU family type III secretion system export apparatus switch protein [Arcobacteraceae bacterium]MDY0364375.1 EscU/YscU/HrcU family type III secretion system export apparatus switch protein [Arcobacteraceae bacterium]
MNPKNKPLIKKAAALNYEMGVDSAPKLIAKGQKEVANKIIEIAKANNIPIKEDKDLVELLSQLELNQEIPTELYKAVAEIFSFIYGLSQKN